MTSTLTNGGEGAPRGALDRKRSAALVDAARARPWSTCAVIAIWAAAGAIAISSVAGVGPLFFLDSLNHLWMVMSVDRTSLIPSPTISGDVVGVFYPHLALYGGTLYWCTYLAGRMLGSFKLAFSLSIVVSFAASFLGTWWAARQVRASMVIASLAGLTMVACPYYLTNVFGRGAWTEFVAIAWLPPAIASLLSVIPRPRALPVALLIVSIGVVSGSPTITLIYGLGFVAVGIVAVIVAAPDWFRSTQGKVTAVAAIACGIGVNAWWIASLAAYANRTMVSSVANTMGAADFTRFRIVFSPWQAVPGSSSTPQLHANAPVWVTIATVVGLAYALATRRMRPRVGIVLSIGLVVLAALPSVWPIWSLIPGPLKILQFPYRTLSYFDLWVVACLILVLASLRRESPSSSHDARSHRIVIAAMITLVGVQALAAIPQIVASHSDALDFDASSLVAGTTPWTYYGVRDYRFKDGTFQTDPPIDVRSSCDSKKCVISGLVPDTPTAIGVIDSPFVTVSPTTAHVGRSTEGFVVVSDPDGGPIEIRRTTPTPARIGLAVSIAAILASMVVVAVTSVRSRRQSWTKEKPVPSCPT